MKGRFYVFVLSLFLTFGLAFGQADQDAGGAAGDQPAQEAPADQDAAGQDAAGQDAAGQEGAPEEEAAEGQEGAAGQDGAAQDDAAGQDGAAGQDAGQDAGQEGEEGVAGGGQADMAADQSIVQVLQSNPDFSMFADAVERAGLSMTLEQQGPFTILAPTNQAFEQANIDLATLDQQALTSLVRNHIISGMVSADQLGTLAGVVTLLGNEYTVAPGADQPVAGAEQQDGEVAGGGAADPAQEDPAQEGQDQAEEQPGDVDPAQDAAADVPMGQPGADGAVGLSVGEASVTQAGMQASSGVVYGIDSVLVPEGVQGIEGGGAAQPAEPGMDEEPAPGEEGQPAEEPTPEIETPEADDVGMGDDADMGDDAGAGDAGMDGAGDAGDAGDAGAGDAGMDDDNN